MTTLRKILTTLLAISFSSGIGLSFLPLAQADPPPWAPAHGYRHHHDEDEHHVAYKYVYYPASQVYYSPVRGGYYYPINGGWQFGAVLPPTIRLGKSVSISLGGPVPYVYHPTVVQRYPVVYVP